MKRIVAMTAAACLATAGCAELYKPNVDLGGADQAKYEADLARCRDEAGQAVDEGNAILGGAILLALLGLVIGAAADSDWDRGHHGRHGYHGGGDKGAAIGAGAGAAVGALLGGAYAASKQAETIDGCLRSQGYTVVTQEGL